MMIDLLHGDCRDVLRTLADNSIDSIITDPPYELGFMGKSWDLTGVAYDVTVWQECLRVLKPGGHLLAFGGSRTYHRLVVAIEDAGFQIRDQIMWVYGSGFPKSLNISKAIDKAAGAEREVIEGGSTQCSWIEQGQTCQGHGDKNGRYGETVHASPTTPATPEAEVWDGWGTALKPAHEPIVMARKPLVGTVANNVLTYGVGGINIDGCRVEGEVVSVPMAEWTRSGTTGATDKRNGEMSQPHLAGRFPANFIHDGSDEVRELFPNVKGQVGMKKTSGDFRFIDGDLDTVQKFQTGSIDNGSAARFFYCAKANKKDRNEGATNHHPTVKPTDLMRYLCRLITPPNGTVLDPFTGSGSTGKAAVLEGFNFIGVEQSAEYIEIAKARIEAAHDD